jgi:anaerobic magnesium-protoporphyrin IX monomethyl ester cyclase
VINRERTAGFRRLFLYKILHYPKQTARLLRRFLRFMSLRDVVYLIVKPFLGVKRGPTRNEVLSRAVEHPALKDAAADLTQVADDLLARVMNESRAERLRIQGAAEHTRRVPDDPNFDRREGEDIGMSANADSLAGQRATR